MKLLVIHGPNLNLLGTREPEVYGEHTLADIDAMLREEARRYGMEIEIFQSNSEGAIIDQLHAAMGHVQGVLLNAGAYTHTSIAIHDAIRATRLRVFEIHLSNIYSREDYRRHSLIAPACEGVIAGFGPRSYLLGLWAMYGDGDPV